MKMRLDRWLATLAVGSRNEVRTLIRGGKVSVNGRVVTDPALSFETETDRLLLSGRERDGRVVRHLMMNKPAGILTAARDAKQPTVMDLTDPVHQGIGCMPVGRLDKDTTGILILTCDGELNHRLLAPGRHVDKVYRATVEGRLTDGDVKAFASGLDLGDFTSLPAGLEILSAGTECSEADVTVREGKFHQVKRMFDAIGHPVTRLHRRRFGPLELDPALAEGQWRELNEQEVNALRQAAGMEER